MQNFYLTKNHVLDNTQFWKENTEKDYCDTLQKLIASKPFGDHKFYIFQFVKRVDDFSGVKKMYHFPRLTKPEPLPGTTLLRADPKYPEEVYIIWTLPDEGTFNLYEEGKIFANEFVAKCVQMYKTNKDAMMKPEPGDLSDKEIRDIYRDLRQKALNKKNRGKPQK